MKKNCIICNKIFDAYPSRIKIGKDKFCSYKCFGISVKNKPTWNKGKKLKSLSNEHKLKISISKKGNQYTKGLKFSKEICRKISERQRGEKSHFWKGGKTLISKLIRTSLKYEDWRQSIFIRDNFTCIKCKIKGGYLEAHHNKKSFNKLLDEIKNNLPLFNLYDAAMIYNPLWNTENGITLCRKCHDKTKRRKNVL